MDSRGRDICGDRVLPGAAAISGVLEASPRYIVCLLGG
jgi:hypothetical protein